MVIDAPQDHPDVEIHSRCQSNPCLSPPNAEMNLDMAVDPIDDVFIPDDLFVTDDSAPSDDD